ncbi:MAG TPA: Rv3235 family protein [Marmoricola sp.]|nr:Rv3235 family protein [Marmoricola sp.]
MSVTAAAVDPCSAPLGVRPDRARAPRPGRGIAGLRTISPPTVSGDVMPLAQPQGVLALELESDRGPAVRPGLRVVTGPDRELDGFSARFAQAVVEVIGGDRGVHQLMRWTTETVYADLMQRSHALHRTTPGDQRLRRVRATVRSVHLFRPHEDAAELSVHVRHGQRSRAIAARIERIEGRWRCTVLDFG